MASGEDRQAEAWLAFDTQVAKWFQTRGTTDEVPEASVTALLAGCDTPTLRVLAGLAQPAPSEIESLLRRVWTERGMPEPTALEHAKLVIDDLLRRLAAGEADPRRGAAEVWRWVFALDLFDHQELFSIGSLDDSYSLSGTMGWDPMEFDAEVVRLSRQILARGGIDLSAAG